MPAGGDHVLAAAEQHLGYAANEEEIRGEPPAALERRRRVQRGHHHGSDEEAGARGPVRAEHAGAAQYQRPPSRSGGSYADASRASVKAASISPKSRRAMS